MGWTQSWDVGLGK